MISGEVKNVFRKKFTLLVSGFSLPNEPTGGRIALF